MINNGVGVTVNLSLLKDKKKLTIGQINVTMLISLPLQNLFSEDCEWSSWGDYSTCPVTCGTGTQIRARTKLVVEDHGGQPCSGLGYQAQQCNTAPCPGTTHICFFTLVCISVGTIYFLRF